VAKDKYHNAVRVALEKAGWTHFSFRRAKRSDCQMDLTQDQHNIKEVLGLVLKDQPSYGNAKLEAIFDSENNRYQVLLNGWTEHKRSFHIVAQIDIRDGLIWVQQDNTELELVNRLLERGIPKERIVLGFHAPYKRPYTGFAVGE
jgi:XisI protein